jgi:hypothetical protein
MIELARWTSIIILTTIFALMLQQYLPYFLAKQPPSILWDQTR